MTLAERLADDLSTVFLVTDEHGETVTYTPENGAARQIVAVCDELAANRQEMQAHHVHRRTLNTFVVRDGTTGISAVRRGDRLTWQGLTWHSPEIVGGDAAALTIRWQLATIDGSGRPKGSTL